MTKNRSLHKVNENVESCFNAVFISADIRAKVSTYAFLLLFSTTALSQESLPFPLPTKNQIKWSIELPKKSKENLWEVEIIAGKIANVDCNQHWLNGEIQQKTLEGFAYPYFVFNTNGNIAATRMGCPDQVLKSEFVAAPSIKIKYSSKLPIIIYSPKETVVRYRLWRTEAESNLAQQK